LGLLGFSPWLAAPVFGVMTAVMAFVGLQLGRAAARFINIRPDLLTGISLVVMAAVMGRGL
jgi:putative Mn2+ efflux pump MntP